MLLQKSIATLSGIAILFVFASLSLALPEKNSRQEARAQTPNVIWRNPENLASRDLYWGAGSPSLAPVSPFTFLKEDKDGESPKFKVQDASGVEWSVKLGVESQTETVATRLLWAVGYFVEEAYYFEQAQINNLPSLSRGKEFVEGGNVVRGARFEPRRKHIERGDYWDWGKNPFAGTPELDGLKVLMVLLNNYDARTQNNRVLLVKDATGKIIENRYVVTDLGATLGKAAGMGGGRSKNDLEDFRSTGFVLGSEDGEVIFDYDTRPTKFGLIAILNPIYYKGEVKKERDMRGIPVAHARWIGALLSQLTGDQLRDAFRAAGYERATMEGYVQALQERINQLSRL